MSGPCTWPCVTVTAKRRPVPVPEACADWVSRSTGSGISCATALTGGYFSQMLRLEFDEQRRALLESWTGPARTSDGTHVKLLANVADTKSAEQAARGGSRAAVSSAPSCAFSTARTSRREEQADLHAGVLAAFGRERTVVVRTLDAGSDKPVAFATVVGEENLRWASAGCDCPSATPVSWCGSLTRSRWQRSRAVRRRG